MCILKLPVVFIVLSVTLSYLEATPMERQGWLLPVLSRNTPLGLNGVLSQQAAQNPKVTAWRNGNATQLHAHNVWLTF
uniref:Secreted protein n=1 Tax=Pelusios castaneus TaxID=367368 RepID=A0A8C8SSS3_9SAUR